MQNIEKALISFSNTIGKLKGTVCIFRKIGTEQYLFVSWIFDDFVSLFFLLYGLNPSY